MTREVNQLACPQTGGALLARLLSQYGFEYVFGVPSEAPELIAPLWQGTSPRYVVLRDERAGPFAANLYARLTGRMAVLDAAPSVGSLLMIPGLAEALNASVPMLALFTDVSQLAGPRRHRGVWNQSTEQAAIIRPAVKYCDAVPTVHALPSYLAYALRVATSGRPGPVALVIPADVLAADAAGVNVGLVRSELAVFPSVRRAPDLAAVEQAAGWITQAERPVILAGGGSILSRAAAEVTQFAETVSIPVATTITGSGVIDERHPLALGTAGFYGVDSASRALERADTIVMVGAKGSGYSTWLWRYPRADQKVIRLDADDADPNEISYESVTLLGDAGLGLTSLRETLAGKPEAPDRAPWLREIQQLKKDWDARRESCLAVPGEGSRLASAKDVVTELDRRSEQWDVLISEASAATGWASLIRPKSGAQRLAFRGLGVLGGTIGGALGACLAGGPERTVVQLSGDGAMGYQLGELATIARLGLKVISIVLNNSVLGAVRVWPGMPPPIGDIGDIDFSSVAVACGWDGFRVSEARELAPALDAAFMTPRPALVDVKVDPDEWAELAFKDGRLVPPYADS
jgi:acetolactate synthase-1/2/3 large subunit